jgi:hypothetical protein
MWFMADEEKSKNPVQQPDVDEVSDLSRHARVLAQARQLEAATGMPWKEAWRQAEKNDDRRRAERGLDRKSDRTWNRVAAISAVTEIVLVVLVLNAEGCSGWENVGVLLLLITGLVLTISLIRVAAKSHGGWMFKTFVVVGAAVWTPLFLLMALGALIVASQTGSFLDPCA